MYQLLVSNAGCQVGQTSTDCTFRFLAASHIDSRAGPEYHVAVVSIDECIGSDQREQILRANVRLGLAVEIGS